MTPVAVPVAAVPRGSSGADWAEVPAPRQDAPGFTKQWFLHPRAELFAWRDRAGAVSAFQFCFVDENGTERMVAWDRDKPGTHHGRVDTGESTPEANRSPVSRETREPGDDGARARWTAVRAGLPADLVGVVEDALGWR